MIESDPVSRVVEYLEPSGYRLLPSSLLISGMTFAFPAVLVGPENTSDIVLVADTAVADDNDFILRQVLGVGRALDIARKNNPLTTIIVGPRPKQSVITAMMSACRVLPIGALPTENPEEILSNWLAILTPLTQKEQNIVADPLGELLREASKLRNDVADIANVGVDGSVAVVEAINKLIIKDLSVLLEEEV